MNKIISLLLILFAFTLSNCAYKADYNASYVYEDLASISQTVEGKALIYTEIKADEKVYNQKPSSFTGSATTLSIKVGEILKNLSVEVFSRKFRDGAYHSNQLKDTEDYAIIIRPEILNYDYRYNQLKNLGFAITPEVKIGLFVYLYGKEGELILEKKYESDYSSAGSYMVSFSPHEKVNKTIHKKVYELLNNVLHDVEGALVSKQQATDSLIQSDDSPHEEPAQIEERLQQLKDLYEKGLITEPEYEQKRNKLLKEL